MNHPAPSSRLTRRQLVRCSAGFALAALLIVAIAPTWAADSAPVRLLTVGNSFANNAVRLLPALARAGGKQLVLLRANLGGASFEEHAKQLTAHEADRTAPLPRPYVDTGYAPWRTRKDGFPLREALQAEPWDFITIQQASILSFRPESFQPHANTLIAYLRQHAPRSRILIHQTWAYREDYADFKDGFDQAGMFAALRANYEQLAREHDLKIIPVGEAFQIARATPRWRFVPDRNFNFKSAVPDALPDQTGSLNVGWRWTKGTAKTKPALQLDYRHANLAGEYLGAAVFYEILFGADVRAVDFTPPGLSPADAAQLRSIAHEAAARYR